MSLIRKLIIMRGIGKAVGSLITNPEYRRKIDINRITSDAITILTISVLTALLGGILFVIAFYALYITLIAAGFTDIQSLGIVAGIIIAIIGVCICIIKSQVKQISFASLASIPTSEDEIDTSQFSINGIVDSFLDGFLSKPKKEPKQKYEGKNLDL